MRRHTALHCSMHKSTRMPNLDPPLSSPSCSLCDSRYHSLPFTDLHCLLTPFHVRPSIRLELHCECRESLQMVVALRHYAFRRPICACTASTCRHTHAGTVSCCNKIDVPLMVLSTAVGAWSALVAFALFQFAFGKPAGKTMAMIGDAAVGPASNDQLGGIEGNIVNTMCYQTKLVNLPPPC